MSEKEKREENLNLSRVFWNSVENHISYLNRISTSEDGRKHGIRSIAIKAGLNPQSISSAIYLNTRLKASTVIRICDALGVTAEEMLFGTTDRRRASKPTLPLDETDNSIAGVARLLTYLKEDQLLAVAIHAANYLGITPGDVAGQLD